jgi:hypothetical protein
MILVVIVDVVHVLLQLRALTPLVSNVSTLFTGHARFEELHDSLLLRGFVFKPLH